MTPFEVTVLSVTLNAAGIVPSANNRFPPPNVIGNIFSQNAGCPTHSRGSNEWEIRWLGTKSKRPLKKTGLSEAPKPASCVGWAKQSAHPASA